MIIAVNFVIVTFVIVVDHVVVIVGFRRLGFGAFGLDSYSHFDIYHS